MGLSLFVAHSVDVSGVVINAMAGATLLFSADTVIVMAVDVAFARGRPMTSAL